MAQYARPASDSATGSWSATPLWSKIDEGAAAEDDVVITSANNTSPDDADLTTTNVTDPTIHTGHILRARWNKSASGGHSINAVLELYQGAPTTTLIATLSVTDISEVEQTSTYTLSEAEAGNITDYTDLYLRVSRQGETGGPPNDRRSLVVEFIELEVPDAAEETITLDKWFQAWVEPVAAKQQLLAAAQEAVAFDETPVSIEDAAESTSQPPQFFIYARGRWQYPSFAALVLEPGDLAPPEEITLDKWWQPASEPARAFSRSPELAWFGDAEALTRPETVSLDKWSQPWPDQPVRGKPSLTWSFPSVAFVEPIVPEPPAPTENVLQEGFLANLGRLIRNG